MSDQAPYKLLKESTKQKIAKQRAFRPFALEIGWIVYDWNRLQEALGQLFSTGIFPTTERIGRAIWHSTDNDRAVRNMLQAALEAAKTQTLIEPRAYEEICWILSQLNKLAGRRNATIHAPLAIFNTSADPEIAPFHHLGHPRALELKGKPLLGEFRWYRDHLEKLADFAEELHFTLVFPKDLAWPDRPQLPSRGHFESRKAKRRKKETK